MHVPAMKCPRAEKNQISLQTQRGIVWLPGKTRDRIRDRQTYESELLHVAIFVKQFWRNEL